MVYRRARSWYSILLVLKLWTEAHNLYRDQNHPKEKEMQEGRVVVWRGLTNSGGKKRSEKQGRKGKTYPTVCGVPENSKEDKKAFFNEQCKEVEGNNRMGKTRALFKKIGEIRETFPERMGMIKDRNDKAKQKLKRLRIGGNYRRSVLGVHWKDWCWGWNSNTLATSPKSWLIGKDSDAGRDWGQKEKGTTEDEMADWHHWLDGHESEWTPGVGDGQGGLACCDSWARKESDTTERLNWTELIQKRS